MRVAERGGAHPQRGQRNMAMPEDIRLHLTPSRENRAMEKWQPTSAASLKDTVEGEIGRGLQERENMIIQATRLTEVNDDHEVILQFPKGAVEGSGARRGIRYEHVKTGIEW